MSGVRTALVTVPDAEVGETLARSLVEEGLAACGNLIPGLVSVYRWEGRVERSEEALLVLKTTAGRIEACMERVVELHPYDVPEFLVLPVEEGFGPYLEWVRDACEGG